MTHRAIINPLRYNFLRHSQAPLKVVKSDGRFALRFSWAIRAFHLRIKRVTANELLESKWHFRLHIRSVTTLWLQMWQIASLLQYKSCPFVCLFYNFLSLLVICKPTIPHSNVPCSLCCFVFITLSTLIQVYNHCNGNSSLSLPLISYS